jgi:hypothetical protein
MNFKKFAQSLNRAFRHLQIAGQPANPQAKLTEAGILLSDASEEIESVIEDIERSGIDGGVKADLYEATALIQEAIQLVTGTHRRLV